MVSQSVLTFTQSALAYFYMVCQPVLTFTQSAPVYFYMASQSVLTFTQSAADHLVRFDSYIRNAFGKKEHVLAIFFDLEKAYDTTCKHGILSDLYDLDFRGHFLTFIDGFLSHRLFQVRAGSTLSDTYEQEMGVPQGLSLIHI